MYWIPCITHNDPQSIEGSISDRYESTDGMWSYEVRSSVSIPHNNGAATVIIKLHIKETSQTRPSDNYEYDVELRSVEYSRNGLICFSYSLPVFDEAKFNEPLRNKIYSQIKGHFHTHLYHTKSGGLKKGFYSYDRQKCNLKKYDGEAITFYLHQISDMVSVEAEFLLDESKELNFDYRPDNEQDAVEYRISLAAFLGRCQDLLGQFTFYSSLLNSKWNRSCTLQPIAKSASSKKGSCTSIPNEELHELAHNIYNTKESLDRINAKVQSAFYLSNIHRHSDLQSEIKVLAGEIRSIASENNGLATKINDSNKLSSRLGWLSLGITIILGSISIWQGCSEKTMSKEDISTVSDRISKHLMDTKNQKEIILHKESPSDSSAIKNPDNEVVTTENKNQRQ